MQTVFACKTLNNLSEAKIFLQIAEKYCDRIDFLDQIAYLQSEIKDYEGSIKTLTKTLRFAQNQQQKYSIRANLAKVYNHLNNPELSLRYSNENLELSQGNDLDTLMEISFSHYLLGDYSKSESMMRELIRKENLPDNIKGRVLYNLGSYDIEAGKFKEGLKGFIDIGHKIGIWKHREIDGIPLWNGNIDKNKTLLIHGEGGIGDEIINVRFIKLIEQRGMKCVWYTNHKDLKEVFNRNGFKTITDPKELEDLSPFSHIQCMAMYLPILLDLEENKVYFGKYLEPSKEHLEKWKKILPSGRKIGLKWSGNPNYEQDLHRSIPYTIVEKMKIDGVKINLQLEKELEQPGMFNVGSQINNIEDTLAILSLCDEVITSCTSIAHMAGSMNLKCKVFPPIASYYVWLGNKKWYGNNMKVYRQTKHKDWNFVLEKVNET